MKDSTEKTILTFKDVLASLKETSRMMDKNDRRMEKSHAKFDRRMEKSRADFERQMKESRAEFDARMKKEEEARILSQKKFDERMKKEEEAWILSRKDYDERMKNLQVNLGGMANSHGSFAEEYFYNSFYAGKQNFFGEKFDDIEKNLKNVHRGLKDEYDIVLFNHVSVALIEVKYRARAEDILKVLKKPETFRILYPDYKDFKIYLALAFMSVEPKVEEECIKQGIAIIKQVGDTVVIRDKHLKVF